MIVQALEAAVVSVENDVLEINKNEIGTHLIRSGAAMATYLGECPVYTIMILGWWSSDAFLHYIRKQVEQFCHTVSHRLLCFLFHRHISELESRVSHLGPRRHDHPSNAKTRRNIGGALAQ